MQTTIEKYTKRQVVLAWSQQGTWMSATENTGGQNPGKQKQKRMSRKLHPIGMTAHKAQNFPELQRIRESGEA